jgi:uncharacterized protein DUF6925
MASPCDQSPADAVPPSRWESTQCRQRQWQIEGHALQVDLCIRLADESNAAPLRECCGRAVFEPGNSAMAIILEIDPHRVFVSKLGRLEVHQAIPPATGKSPDGPHTHVLPKLLRLVGPIRPPSPFRIDLYRARISIQRIPPRTLWARKRRSSKRGTGNFSVFSTDEDDDDDVGRMHQN